MVFECYIFLLNKDKNVHRYAVRGGKDREREREDDGDSMSGREIEKDKRNIYDTQRERERDTQ